MNIELKIKNLMVGAIISVALFFVNFSSLYFRGAGLNEMLAFTLPCLFLTLVCLIGVGALGDIYEKQKGAKKAEVISLNERRISSYKMRRQLSYEGMLRRVS